MRVISWNVNGLRSAYRNDFLKWAESSGADIIALQEVKAQESDVAHLPLPQGYSAVWNCGKRKGYSGVVCYVKNPPIGVNTILGHERFDNEGRFLELEYKEFTFINLYIPNGARDKRDVPYKIEVYEKLTARIKKLLKKKVPLLIVGDMNIARNEIDLARPKENKNNTMFSPEERASLEKFIESGIFDTFRILHPDEVGRYSWWPYFANARPRNMGWRIDYAFASSELLPRLKEAFILDEIPGSDHCPVGVDLKGIK